MKVAFSVWNGRIAPVFDVARQLCLIEVNDIGDCSAEQFLEIPNIPVLHKVKFLQEKNISILVCGAISRVFGDILLSRGIEVLPFVAGEYQQVITAWRKGENFDEAFAMPGCVCRQNRKRRRFGQQSLKLDSECLCSQCDYSEPHERGIPCNSKRCPICGAALIRC